MRHYNILPAFLLAFYSKTLYQEVRNFWSLRHIFLYLLLLITLCSIPLTYHCYNFIKKTLLADLRPTLQQIPILTFTQGKLSIDKPLPYFITAPASKQPLIIFDTAQHIDTYKNSPARILLTEHVLFVKKHNTILFEKVFASRINGQYDIAQLLSKEIKWGLVLIIGFIYPLLLLSYFILALVEAIIYATLGKLFSRKMSFRELFKLAVVAITPKFILAAVLSLFLLSIPYKILGYFAVGMFYLFFAIEANKSTPLSG